MSNLWKLVKYTQGGNVDGKANTGSCRLHSHENIFIGKILKMCLPIMVKVRPSMSDEKENHFTLMLVLTKENHLTPPPASTVEDVYIYQHPEQIIYAKRFGGFAKEAD